MKHTLLKIFAAVVMAITAMPLMAQDYMNVYFKDGTFRKFYLHNVTEITTSQTDADGIKHADYDYQHVSTLFDTYVYCLDDVDYITFTKFNEEEAEQNLTDAINTLLPTISENATIADMEEHIDDFQESDAVEEAWSDGHELHLKIKGWETITFHPNHDSFSGDVQAARTAERFAAMVTPAKAATGPKGRKLRAVIANQQANDESRIWYVQNCYEPLAEKLRASGIEVDYIDRPSVDFFNADVYNAETDSWQYSIYHYDFAFLITHGGYMAMTGGSENLQHAFATGMELACKEKGKETFTVEEATALRSVLSDIRRKYGDATDQQIQVTSNEETRDGRTFTVFYVTLSEQFFEEKAETTFQNANSILFNTACQSLKDNDNLATAFCDNRNLGVYIGYTETNSVGKRAGPDFFTAMLDGLSLETAVEGLQDDYKEEHRNHDGTPYVATLRVVAHDGLDANSLFLAPVITEPVTSEAAAEQYDAAKAVTIKGATTTSNDAIRRGFIYGTEKESLWNIVSLTNGNMTENTGNGNFSFETTITSLEPGNTYYYCAYTHDGKYYNYGDTLSFYIDYPKLVLAENALTLEAGQSGQIEVTSGSGSYAVWVYAPEVANITVSGSTISVTALQAGKTVVQVTDQLSGHKVSFGVEVVWPNVVLDKNELHIKVGESAQINITSGSGSYTVQPYDPDVVLTVLEGSVITVTALKAGKSVVYVTDDQSERRVAFGVEVKPDEVPANAVDLGLPSGTLWASYNIGAKKPEDYGSYFAWGETSEKDSYTWGNYTHCDGSKDNCHYLGDDIAGTEYDVAHELWGGDWTMPTVRQLDELTTYCTATWVTQNGVKGCLVTGPNNNTIFLPAAGVKAGTGLYYDGETGYYKSSSIDPNDLAEAWQLDVEENNFVWMGTWNYYGYTVRPVITPAPVYVENADQPVDLGLPSGTLWAQCNLGASQPHESGNYYAWGDTQPKEKYDEAGYAYYNSSSDTYTDIGNDISFTKYDAAHEALGGTWHTPTYADFTELTSECSWVFTTFNGVFGYRVTGPNGNSIFLPCADAKDDESYYPAPVSYTDGYYWSADFMEEGWSSVLHFTDEGFSWPHGYFRFLGMSIRPCKSK